MKEDLWKPYIKIYRNGGQKFSEYGMYLSKEERGRIQEIVMDVVKSIVLPWAERKFKALFGSVIPKRLVFFFVSEEDTSKENAEKTNWELRFTADLALLLQDYNNAAIHYKRLFERLSKGNLYNEIASSKEFYAISSFILNGSRNDFLKNMEFVLQCYEKANNFGLIVRNSIYAFDILRFSGSSIDASDYLAKTSHYVAREAEASAVFLEQAAFTVLKYSFVRKFIQYVVYAGTYYAEQGFVRNQIYCLEVAYALYEKANWPKSLIYICDLLGAAYAEIEKLEQSFNFYKKAIEISIEWKTAKSQDNHYKAFLNIAEKIKKKFTKPPTEQEETTKESNINPIKDKAEETNKEETIMEQDIKLKTILQMNSLLIILKETLEFFLSQDQIYCNDKQRLYRQAYDLAERHVKNENVVEKYDEMVYNRTHLWMTLGKLMDGNLADPFDNSLGEAQIAREEGLRDLLFYDIKHPEQKAMLYTRKKRIVHAGESVYLKFFCKNPLSVPLEITELKIVCYYTNTNNKEDINYYNNPLTLKENEEHEIVLWIVPKKKGELCIDGIEWTIANLVSGSFTIQQLTNKDEPIILEVKEKAGELEVKTDKDLRTSYFNGEIDYYRLKLKNIGDLPVSNISLCTDYPVLLGWKTLDLDWILNKDEEKELTIYIQPRFIRLSKGKELLISKILVRYNASENKTYYRYKRIEHSFTVNSSFDIVSKTVRSHKNLNKHLLNLQIEQIQAPNTNLQLSQLCVINDDYKIIESSQFTEFGKVFNSFIALTHVQGETASLDERRILYKDTLKSSEDITTKEPYVNYIKEFKDYRVNKHNKRKIIATIVDILAIWTLEQEEIKYKGCTLIQVYLSFYYAKQNAIAKEPSVFPLQVVHESPDKVNHNFSMNPICKVELRLVLKNSLKHPISFRFEALKVVKGGKDKSMQFIWQGQVVKNIIGLKYEEAKEIKLDACITRPGVYDLNRFIFRFYRDPHTGEDLDPSMDLPKNVITKVFILEMQQIVVTVLNAID